MTPSETERIKFTAAALDRLSTGLVTVGILTPGIGYLYNLADMRRLVTPTMLALGAAPLLVAAVILHLFGRRILGRLR